MNVNSLIILAHCLKWKLTARFTVIILYYCILSSAKRLR